MTDLNKNSSKLKVVMAVMASLAFAVSGCAPERAADEAADQAEEKPVRLTALEFRAAAADIRVSWRDPDISAKTDGETWIKAKILGFNDFHGNLNARNIGGRPVGGAATFAAFLKAEAAEVDGRAVIVHAGDMVGASPPVSALVRDEPSIGFLNLLANENCTFEDRMAALCNVVGALGNHEFDDGSAEVLRLLNGGRHAEDDDQTTEWRGSKAPYVAANVVVAETGELLLPPYVIKDVGGVPVAFIGATLRSAPDVVIAGRIADLAFLDEATAINSYVPELQAKGVRAIVVTIHQGLRQYKFGTEAIIGADKLEGEILTIIGDLDAEIDIVISGHAHG